MTARTFVLRLDFALLRRQKAHLLRLRGGTPGELDGLLELLDALQDQAVDVHGLPEAEVFGPDDD